MYIRDECYGRGLLGVVDEHGALGADGEHVAARQREGGRGPGGAGGVAPRRPARHERRLAARQDACGTGK